MNSVAFLFLTYDEVEQYNLWEKYFESSDPLSFQIYVHCKTPNKIHQQKLFASNLIKTVPTSWGSWSLIEAQKKLLEEALKNQSNQHFIFVSHNTIPIQSFKNFYDFIQDKKSLFYYNIASHPQHIPRFSGIKDPCFSSNEFLFASQWSVLSRKNAEQLVGTHEMIQYHYGNIYIPDEHAYINFLVYHLNEKIQNKMITYYQYDPNNYDKPFIFYKLNMELLKSLIEKDIFFLRKITPNTDVSLIEL